MHELETLERQIKDKLAASDEQRRSKQAGLQREMEEMERRSRRFAEVATPLFQSVVRPRIETLVNCFENARVQNDPPSQPLSCVCWFDRNEVYPATTKLTVEIAPGDEMRNVVVSYSLEILPIFFRFDGHDQIAWEVEKADSDRVAQWVDKKILDFLDVYLQLQHVDQYQRDNLVTDPVCGMHINKTLAVARADHDGGTYYFCTDKCHNRFKESPSEFVPKTKP